MNAMQEKELRSEEKVIKMVALEQAQLPGGGGAQLAQHQVSALTLEERWKGRAPLAYSMGLNHVGGCGTFTKLITEPKPSAMQDLPTGSPSPFVPLVPVTGPPKGGIEGCNTVPESSSLLCSCPREPAWAGGDGTASLSASLFATVTSPQQEASSGQRWATRRDSSPVAGSSNSR